MAFGRSRVYGLLKEPLVHFLVLGGLLFTYSGLTVEPASDMAENRVTVTSAETERIAVQWVQRWKRVPTPEELKGLIDEYVREQVLYREALALGLDRDDPVMKRLLRQKYEFVVLDLAVDTSPDRSKLMAFYEANRDRYRRPSQLSFTQVFFNSDRRGAAGEADARLALASLRDGSAEPFALGDGGMLDAAYSDRTGQEIEAIFGPEFAEEIEILEPGVWSGPIASGFGYHLVWLDAIRPGEAMPFAEVEENVRNDWIFAERRRMNDEIYRKILEKYEVVVEPFSPESLNDGGDS